MARHGTARHGMPKQTLLKQTLGVGRKSLHVVGFPVPHLHPQLSLGTAGGTMQWGAAKWLGELPPSPFRLPNKLRFASQLRDLVQK